MFSTGSRDRHDGARASNRGAYAGDPGSSGETSEGTSAARLDAAIKAAIAVDSTRGEETFPYHNFTPPGSVGASGNFAGGGGGGRGPTAGYGGAVMPVGTVDYAGSRDSGNSNGSRGAYRTYHPAAAAANAPRNGVSPGYSSATGYPSRVVAPVDDSVTSGGSLGPRSGSGASLGTNGRGSGHAYKGGGGGADLAAGGAAAGDHPSFGNGGGRAGHGHGRGIGSGGSGGSGGSARGAAAAAAQQQQQAQQRRSTWEWGGGAGGGAPTPRAVWQPEPPGGAAAGMAMTPALGQQTSKGSSDGFSSDGRGAGPGSAAFQNQLQKSRKDFSEHINADSSGAIAPPQQWVRRGVAVRRAGPFLLSLLFGAAFNLLLWKMPRIVVRRGPLSVDFGFCGIVVKPLESSVGFFLLWGKGHNILSVASGIWDPHQGLVG